VVPVSRGCLLLHDTWSYLHFCRGLRFLTRDFVFYDNVFNFAIRYLQELTLYALSIYVNDMTNTVCCYIHDLHERCNWEKWFSFTSLAKMPSYMSEYLNSINLHTAVQCSFYNVTCSWRRHNLNQCVVGTRLEKVLNVNCLSEETNQVGRPSDWDCIDRGPMPQQVWHDKDPSMIKGRRRRHGRKSCSPTEATVTSACG
jgi:hypothetical protein